MRPIQGQKFHPAQPVNQSTGNSQLLPGAKSSGNGPWHRSQPRYATACHCRWHSAMESSWKQNEDSTTHDGHCLSSFRKVSNDLKNELPKCGCYMLLPLLLKSSLQKLAIQCNTALRGNHTCNALVCHFHQVTHSSATNATASPWHSQVTCIPQAKKICSNSYRHTPQWSCLDRPKGVEFQPWKVCFW